jgi:hypothetical protein
LTEEYLVSAIEKVLSDPSMSEKASLIGQKLRSEDGVSWTIDKMLSLVSEKGQTWWESPQRPQFDERNQILSAVSQDGSKPADEAVWRLMSLLFDEKRYSGVLAYAFYATEVLKYEIPVNTVETLVLPSLQAIGRACDISQWRETVKDACTQR